MPSENTVGQGLGAMELFSGYQEVPFDQSTPITITPPSGYRLVITSLLALGPDVGSPNIANVTISSQDTTYIDNKTLLDGSLDQVINGFAVGQYGGVSGSQARASTLIPTIEAKTIGESITISTDTTITTTVLYLSYAYTRG